MNNSNREKGHDELLRRAGSPKSVFEFGCNHGKILRWFRDELGATVSGLDVSEPAVKVARDSGLSVVLADDRDLHMIAPVELAVTYYVLCHIPFIDDIVDQLKRIAPRILSVEAQELRQGSAIDHWYIHDFEKLGFYRVGGPFHMTTTGWLWEWKRR